MISGTQPTTEKGNGATLRRETGPGASPTNPENGIAGLHSLVENLAEKDRLLADLHARFLPLLDGTLREEALRGLWLDLFVFSDRIAAKERDLRLASPRLARLRALRSMIDTFADFCRGLQVEILEALSRSGVDTITPLSPAFDPATQRVVMKHGEPPLESRGTWVVSNQLRPGFRTPKRVVRKSDVVVRWSKEPNPKRDVEAPETKERS